MARWYAIAALGGLSFAVGVMPATGQEDAAAKAVEAAKQYEGTTINTAEEAGLMAMLGINITGPEWEKLTGIKVRVSEVPYEELFPKAMLEHRAGTGAYDMLTIAPSWVADMVRAGALEPLDPYIEKYGVKSEFDDIAPAFRDWMTFDGKTYALVVDGDVHILYYRKDLFQDPANQEAFKAKYGYDLAPAKTIEQMRDIAEFFTRKKGEKLAGATLESDFYGILLEGIKGGTTWWTVWNSFVRNWGGDILDENGSPSVDRPENVAAVEFWADLWQFGPPGMAEASLIDVPTLMGQGVTAQALAWSDFGLGIDREGASPYAGKFVYAPSPVNADYDGQRSAEIEPSIMIVSQSSDAPEATYLFIQWMADRDTQLALAEQLGAGVPNRYSLFEAPIYRDSRLAPLYAAMRGSLEYGEGKPRVPQIYQINDALAALVQQVGLGQLTAEEAMRQGQTEVLSICDPCTLEE
jgi:multiple sugar transport system substrate-binding protein